MKETCQNCHFLSQYLPPGVAGKEMRFSWGSKERSEFKIKDHYGAECYKGVWSAGIDPSLNARLRDVLLQDRKDSCFFVEMHPGMSFQAAEELFRMRNDNRQLKRSYRYTQIGLWLVAIGLLANVLIQAIKFFISA